MDLNTAKCPFCKGGLIKSVINSTSWALYCNRCIVNDDEWSKYIIFTDGVDWTQKITVGNYYIINASVEPTTELFNLESCVLLNQMTVPKMKIDPFLGEEKIYEVLKTLLVFS
jgi:hypothetical protein